MDGVHHERNSPVQQALGGLRIEVADQLGRADDVREQNGDLLPLAVERIPAGQDLLGEVPRGVASR
jgi:hypothetical protein